MISRLSATAALLASAALLLSACDQHLFGSGKREGELRIASWNLEHLAERDGTGCKPRDEADYEELRQHAEALGADVVAFQEVESKAAAERVFLPAEWQIEIEERVSGGGGGCRGLPGQTLLDQRVGFAIRRGVAYTRNPDLTELGLSNKGLRTGVDVTITGGEPLRLLSVHLKSGCNSGRAASDRDCDVLFEQLPVLERWVDGRAGEGAAFAVLGDWNRRLASRGDAVWTELDDGEPAESDLSLASGEAKPSCKQQYREFIDFVVLSRTAAGRAVPGSFSEYTYGVPEDEHPSDHCPVSVVVSTR